MNTRRGAARRGTTLRTSVGLGVLAAAVMAAFYAAVVAGASGSVDHLVDQIRTDSYLLGPIVVGFGTQIGLIVELRRRRRLARDAAIAGTAGAGGSTVGMVACCAHHVAELAPFVALTGAATLLITYRLAFVVVGLAATAIGILVAIRRLRHLPVAPHREGVACAAH